MGLQVLCASSEESPAARGLGVLPRDVSAFGPEVQVPQLGWNRVRFTNPVPVGARIRTKGKVKSVEQKGPMLEVVNEMTVEIEGQERPACVAESVLRIGF